MKVSDFEEALKLKNNEIVKLKNAISKHEREINIKDQKITEIEKQMEEYLDKPDDSFDEYKNKILALESQIRILKEEEGENEMKDRLILMEISIKEKDNDIQKYREQIDQLQKYNVELEEDIDNLKNELSTINEGQLHINGEAQRASIEGLKLNQLERDLKKTTTEKIRLDSELQKANHIITELEEIKKDRDNLRERIQVLFNEKNEIQDKLYSLKEEKLKVDSELKSSTRELKHLTKEVEDCREKEALYKKEIDTLMKSNGGSISASTNDTIAVLEKDKVILQKESEISNLKLELKEKDEEYQKLDDVYRQVKDKIDTIKAEYRDKIKNSEENQKIIIDTYKQKLKDQKTTYEGEQRLLITAISNIGFEAYKSFNGVESNHK